MKADICSIVYNERTLIELWIKSWLSVPWVNKIYLVDGGSTDGTVQAAKQFGDRVSVMSVPWKNDFARQRNIATKLAKADYMLQPDIDEIPAGNLNGDIEKYRCPHGNYHFPYLKFYDWNRLWFFTDGNTPRRNGDKWIYGQKYTMNAYKKGTIVGYSGHLHEQAIFTPGEDSCHYNGSNIGSNDFFVGHYDQTKHFEQARQEKTSVEYQMGLKRVRYRLISPAVYNNKVYDPLWAREALKKNSEGDTSMIEELGTKQLESFLGQHEVLSDDMFYLNNEIIKKEIKL